MSDNISNNKRIAKNTAFLYVRMLFILIVSLYTSRVVLRTLGVVDFGVNNVVAGFVSMFAFLNSTLTNSIQRFYNFELGKNGVCGMQKVYQTSILIQVILAVITVLAVETIGVWYLETKMVIPADRIVAARWVFQCAVAGLVFVIMGIPYSSAIMAHEKMDYYAIVGILDAVLKLALVFALPHIPYDKLIMYGCLTLSVNILNFLLYFVYSKLKFKELKFKLVYYKDLFKAMLGFSGWNVVGTFANMLKGQGVNMILNIFFGPVVNAARGIAYQMMNALQGFTANIVVAFRPQLVQSYALGNYQRVKNIFFSESKISYVLMTALVVPVIIEMPYLLDIWLGKDAVPDYTVPFANLVLLNMLISTLNTPCTQIVHATGKVKTYQIAYSVLITSILPISWVVLKLGGNPTSVFVVSLVVTIFNQCVSLFIVRKVFDYSIKEYVKVVIIPCAIISVLLPIAPFMITKFMETSFIRLAVVCVLDIMLAIVISYAFVLNSSEKEMVLAFVNKIIKKK